jgi:short-subunit dehydrogenase
MKKVIIITGGSDGLGKEIAKQLSTQNEVVIVSNNKEKLVTVAAEIGCDFQVADVTKYAEITMAVGNVINKYGKIDCLINNAGVWIEGELSENDEREIEKVLAVNTLGTIEFAKSVIPQMKIQKEGRIINIISQAGFYAKAKRSVYAASKFALTGFTKSLSEELAVYGIGVMGIYPGKMNTQLFEKAGIHKQMDDAVSPESVAKIIDFMLSFDNNVVFPEVGIKNING